MPPIRSLFIPELQVSPKWKVKVRIEMTRKVRVERQTSEECSTFLAVLKDNQTISFPRQFVNLQTIVDFIRGQTNSCKK